MALTDLQVKQAKSKNKPYTLKDILGLSLFIPSSGNKRWHFRFTFEEKESRISFGIYLEVSLQEARIKCEEAQLMIKEGIDPRSKRPAQTEENKNTLNQTLKSIGYAGRLTSYGMRGTLSTGLYEMEYEPRWVEGQLSHVDPSKVVRAYNHAKYVPQRHQMMQNWADLIDQWEREGLDYAKTG